jgi:biotin synthase
LNHGQGAFRRENRAVEGKGFQAMPRLEDIKKQVLAGGLIGKNEAMEIRSAPLEALCAAANEIREHFCGNAFDICTIVNAKSGRCAEDCKYCAQSAFNRAKAEEYPLLGAGELVEQARYSRERGVLRYSIVTSGLTPGDGELERICEGIRAIRRHTGISVCVSLGLLTGRQLAAIREAGADRVHNNLETSRNRFAKVCTTHAYDDKLGTIRAAREAGLSVCSGGIMGLGETMEDRIDMALDIRELGVRSIPVNLLNPIPGTPFENNPPLSNNDMRRIVALFRFLVPDAAIRLAGGRVLLPDRGRQCFLSGANAAISGDMLTTSGISIGEDMKMLGELGYRAAMCNG